MDFIHKTKEQTAKKTTATKWNNAEIKIPISANPPAIQMRKYVEQKIYSEPSNVKIDILMQTDPVISTLLGETFLTVNSF